MKRALVANPLDASYVDDLSDEHVSDVVLLGDQSHATQFLKTRTEAVAKRVKHAQQVARLVETHYPTILPAVTKAEAKAAAKKADADLAREKSRVYARLLSEDKSLVEDAMPCVCRVLVDEFNGRFRMYYPGFKDRSISWSKRSVKVAIQEALTQAWDWHFAVTGVRMPAHLTF